MPSVLRLEPVPFDDPVAQALIDRIQQEYVHMYGGPDETVVDPAQFAPPQGLFLLAYGAGGLVLGCGGWRAHGTGAAEIKRMFVVPEARGRGVARALLTELERTAAAAARPRLVLLTGTAQPAAIALYLSCGYRPVPGFGPYVGEPDSQYFGKDVRVD